MKGLFSHLPGPVKRAGAERYLLYTLLSFAGSVILTRGFLALTGYPQVGGGTLHIAHVLWGGLLLFIASILPLIISNRWVYTFGAVLSGIGVGLFIDEVGKFITQSNDYFFPAAAPIIYAFFLLTVLLYSQVRRPPAQDARAELYRALDGMEEVLDHDLSERERAELAAQLRYVTQQGDHPDLRRLATVLLDFVSSDAVVPVIENPSLWQRTIRRIDAVYRRWISRRVARLILALWLTVLGLLSFGTLLMWVTATVYDPALALVGGQLDVPNSVQSTTAFIWFLLRIGLEGVVGFALLLAVRYLFVGRERSGTTIAYYGLLFSLSSVNLLVFYFDQFKAIFDTLAQFALLMAVMYYRHLYLQDTASPRGRG